MLETAVVEKSDSVREEIQVLEDVMRGRKEN